MEKEPIWVRQDVVRALHSEHLAEHGGRDGVLSEDLLDSALHAPKHFFFYAKPHPDIPSVAARYAHGISQSHPFVDGNKRTASIVCELFLELNGYELTATDEDSYGVFMQLAAGDLAVDELAGWITRNCRGNTSGQ